METWRSRCISLSHRWVADQPSSYLLVWTSTIDWTDNRLYIQWNHLSVLCEKYLHENSFDLHPLLSSGGSSLQSADWLLRRCPTCSRKVPAAAFSYASNCLIRSGISIVEDIGIFWSFIISFIIDVKSIEHWSWIIVILSIWWAQQIDESPQQPSSCTFRALRVAPSSCNEVNYEVEGSADSLTGPQVSTGQTSL